MINTILDIIRLLNDGNIVPMQKDEDTKIDLYNEKVQLFMDASGEESKYYYFSELEINDENQDNLAEIEDVALNSDAYTVIEKPTPSDSYMILFWKVECIEERMYPDIIKIEENEFFYKKYVFYYTEKELHEKYGIVHTGVVIENYEAQTDGKIVQQNDLDRFKYFGNSLLANGGELGYHGYNHQPLSPSSVNYGEKYASYKTWKDKAAMKASLSELIRFVNQLFPKAQKSVYVPPSNILSKEGREVIVNDFPEIKAISSNYFPGDFTYSQEFEVSPDGMIEEPRTVSGAVWDDFSQMTVFSEMNMHYVNNHFLHPDDVLDVDRGAELGWAKMYKALDKEVSWVHNMSPSLRNLTGSELAGAVQRYGILKVSQKYTKDALKIDLENFHDHAYLMVRLNQNEVKKVKNGKVTHLTGDLYLLEATNKSVTITLK